MPSNRGETGRLLAASPQKDVCGQKALDGLCGQPVLPQSRNPSHLHPCQLAKPFDSEGSYGRIPRFKTNGRWPRGETPQTRIEKKTGVEDGRGGSADKVFASQA